jgi:hypothetical protein
LGTPTFFAISAKLASGFFAFTSSRFSLQKMMYADGIERSLSKMSSPTSAVQTDGGGILARVGGGILPLPAALTRVNHFDMSQIEGVK